MFRSLSVLATTVLISACAAAPPVQRLRFADASAKGAKIDWTKPFVLEIQPGDRLPVRISFSDQIFDLNPAAPPIELVARRHGYIRVEPGRISSSLTGADFDTSPLAPGQFRFGLAITRQGTWLELAVTTPRHAEPPRSR